MPEAPDRSRGDGATSGSVQPDWVGRRVRFLGLVGFERRMPAWGLAAFRIGVAACLIVTVLHLLVFRHLIFDPLPYVERSSVPMLPALLVWLVALTCLLVGFQTRVAALVNWVFMVSVIGPIYPYDYHGDVITTFYSLVLVFAPSNRVLSVDAVRARRRGGAGGATAPGPVPTVAGFWHVLVLVSGLALVYADSVLFKLASPHWREGLGVWLPASLIPYNLFDLSFVLDVEVLARGLGFLVLAYETVFVLAMWVRRLRPLLVAVGMGLHLGIAVAFPIPVFGIVAAAALLLLVPADWWYRLAAWRRDGDRPVAAPWQRWSRRRVAVAATVVAVLVVVQVVETALNGTMLIRGPVQRLDDTGWAHALERRTVRYAGIGNHPLFIRPQFAGYDHSAALTIVGEDGEETWLPITRNDGRPGYAGTGRIWKRWAFGTMGAYASEAALRDGLEDFTAYYAHQHGVSLDDATFRLKVKAYGAPSGYRRGELHRALDVPWYDAGTARWKDGEFSLDVAVIEIIPVDGNDPMPGLTLDEIGIRLDDAGSGRD